MKYKIKKGFISLDKQSRLYGMNRPIIGLTGGIGTGKTTASHRLFDIGFPLIEADKLVHNVYKQKTSVKFVHENFPTTIKDDGIDFVKLREIFFNDSYAKSQIEQFIYPQLKKQFLKQEKNLPQESFLIYDVPLLFETGMHHLVDISVCICCSPETQISRIMKRDHINLELTKKIIKKQMNMEVKRQIADWVIENNGTLEELEKQIQRFINHYFVKNSTP
jgi:dephospho-CoA kinase